jgi:acyl carrier protein
MAAGGRIGRYTSQGEQGKQHMLQRQMIKRYLLENFLFSTDDSALGDQDSLIRGGILDSTGIHELVLFIEEEFQIVVAPEEMTPANFDSIAAVDAFVSGKRTPVEQRNALPA